MLDIVVEKNNLKSLIESRKMSSDEVMSKYETINNKVIFKNFEELKKLSDKLAVPIKDFFIDNDLDEGIKIGRKVNSFSRTVERQGAKYYTYNHLATTKTEPNLMALRVDLHCKDVDKVTLNNGHNSKEIVYITKGKVRIDWKTENGSHFSELNIGDSVYVSPNIPHSFLALEDNSELIAINY